ncbi:maltotransferase domain-containing protein [Parvularcula dongshanensis]|uniref:Alpha-1,4-glucan:maltose-1-phosphate maltosyltransferase n=1 Tax=Parvularcula dongshanensis TaxID=1173995 RepID=A0A840I4W0_9PROT|nr:maltotransferase domain-containing protein [Parvularcula dongshanensis]MBB4659060.1 starch synthase (maltosyl-transferring) [Parvularcula dongshanensis]
MSETKPLPGPKRKARAKKAPAGPRADAPAKRKARSVKKGAEPQAPVVVPSKAPLILAAGSHAPGAAAEMASRLGFTAILVSPYGPMGKPVRDVPDDTAAAVIREAGTGGAAVIAEMPWLLHARSSPLIEAHPDWFEGGAGRPEGPIADPRLPSQREARRLLIQRQELWEPLGQWFAERAKRLAAVGATGVRLPDLASAPAPFWSVVVGHLREALPDLLILGDALGGAFSGVAAAQDAGFDYILASDAWWDGRAGWFWDQKAALRVPTLGMPQGPDGDELRTRMPAGEGFAGFAASRTARSLLTSEALLVPASLIDQAGEDYEASLKALLAARKAAGWLDVPGPLVPAGTRGLLRASGDLRSAEHAWALAPGEGEALTAAGGLMVPSGRAIVLGTDRLVALTRRDGTGDKALPERQSRKLLDDLASRRVAIEDVYPVVNAGRFPAKRIVGDTLAVGADVFVDGHDIVAADLVLTEPGADPVRVPMRKGLNDRFGAQVTLTRMGSASFAIEAFKDRYASWLDEVTKKRAAGVNVEVETIEGQQIVEASLKVAEDAKLTEDEAEALRVTREAMRASKGETEAMLAALTNPALGEVLRRHGERAYLTRSRDYPLTVDRRQARFSSWYELFPRSQSGTTERHGTFDDVIGRLPYVKDLGFDVLYFPPIHPVGKTNRKGKNNSLKAEPGDVGSPYAIGSEEGGYTSVHPELGTIEDFDRLVTAAAEHGLEIALDIALNSSPDHPWIKSHPEWFDHRPDGTIKFAENPPKKYEDIVNLHYYGEAIPGLWYELRDMFLFWCEHRVRMFRIDNPHTKPYPLWEWIIAEVKRQYPDALFLSEAFTRPKVMKRLGKLGFTQSYTYYTWRNTKHELQTYVEQLTQTDDREVMNPNFFINTPDINPIPLQTNNRTAHVARTILAGTLASSYGLYNGIEIVESTVLPGKEEYLNSEKYEIRVWDMDRPGHIKDDIRLLNRLRRYHPALQDHCTVRFLTAWNDQVIWYAKRTPDLRDYLLFAVTFDYHGDQRAPCELPLWEFGLPDDASIDAQDLVTGSSFTWHGKMQDITLGPDRPYAAFQLFGPEDRLPRDPAPLYNDPKGA